MSKIEIPYISGEWRTLFRPIWYGRYVNDHTVYKDVKTGEWHLVGITSKQGKPNYERYFVHAVGASLDKPMREVCKVIDTGTLAWAPCVTHANGVYYMYYGPSPTKLAVSNDSVEWFGYTAHLENEPPMTCHRDHFVLKNGDEWIMYVSGVIDGRSAISYLVSTDMVNWQYKGAALSSSDKAPLQPAWGAMESPYVVKRGDYYYLFVTYTDCNIKNYNDTLVFVSDNPYCFGVYQGEGGETQPIALIKAHAPEVICENGKTYITTCGWKKQSIGKGKVMIAELKWK